MFERPVGHAGIALVEVLVAGALFAAVIVGVFPLFLSSQRSNVAAAAYAEANALARDGLEDLLALPFDDVRLAVGEHAVNDLPPTGRDPENGAPTSAAHPFRRTYRVLQFSVPDGASVPREQSFRPRRIREGGVPFDYKRIDVTVEPAFARGALGLPAARVSAIRENPDRQTHLSAPDRGP
ncbi:MAG TPA: hypothetical protein VNC59_03635 [Thermoanaerobaculia bacterium]|nr:hypothetical protein [Thermoanaerobaculia bacterium]